MQHVFYIHGFNSSPQSAKARLLGDYLKEQHPAIQYQVPGLAYAPAVAIKTLGNAIEQVLRQDPQARIGLVGSSMGGFYGTWAAEQFDLPLVLVNPAVYPYRLLQDYLGENTNPYTGETYTFTEANIKELKALEVDPLTRPERYLLLAQTNDEVLDYREAVERYAGSEQIVEPGGSHGFDGFERHLDKIIQFLFQEKQEQYDS